LPGHIHYFCEAGHSYTLGIFAAFHAQEIAEAIRLIPYQFVDRVDGFGPGAYIFTDFDRLVSRNIEELSAWADALLETGRTVLNHPKRALGRFDLLRTLHGAELNRFNVHRLEDAGKVERFPVFIRNEGGHGRTLTDLIPDRPSLEAAAAALATRPDREDLMIVEFGNVPGADGRYRKYSAYRVGEVIYPQHCFSSPGWWIKFNADDMDEEQIEEHLDYVATNPHREPLREVFELAGIDYGRIDYCMVDGRVQTFEINTNPTVVQGTAYRAGDMSQYAKLHEDALLQLIERASDGPICANPFLEPGRSGVNAKIVSDYAIDATRKSWLRHDVLRARGGT
jgi:hypothetical protein